MKPGRCSLCDFAENSPAGEDALSAFTAGLALGIMIAGAGKVAQIGAEMCAPHRKDMQSVVAAVAKELEEEETLQ